MNSQSQASSYSQLVAPSSEASSFSQLEASSSEVSTLSQLVHAEALYGHLDQVTRLLVLPDRRLVSGGLNGRLVVWAENQGMSGEIIQEFNAPILELLLFDSCSVLVAVRGEIRLYCTTRWIQVGRIQLPNFNCLPRIKHLILPCGSIAILHNNSLFVYN